MLICRMFWFGKPYFSGNSLVRTGALDPPRFQRTSTRVTINPGSIDPSNPSSSSAKNAWPPDPSRLYYSTYGPHSGILELDSLTGNAWKWKQDRWYVDMRGDVDEEGWEYAYIWDGRYYFIGGNWHGKSVLGHSWVRRRRWVRELVRKKRDKKAVKDGKKEEQVGKPGGGGFDGLLIHLRAPPSPNLRRKLLKEFFDACLPKTLKQLSSYIRRIYMLIDPLSTMDLIRILESQLQTFESEEAPDTELTTAIKTSLEYLNSKHESLAIRTGRLPPLKHLPEKDWSSHSPSPIIETLIPSSRRSRLRKLRTQWRQSAEPSIAKLVKKVRFQTKTAMISEANSPETPGTRYVDAPEEPPSLGAVGRAISSDSGREEWFVAPESAGEKVEPAKSVGGLLRMKGELSGQVEERETGKEEDGTK